MKQHTSSLRNELRSLNERIATYTNRIEIFGQDEDVARELSECLEEAKDVSEDCDRVEWEAGRKLFPVKRVMWTARDKRQVRPDGGPKRKSCLRKEVLRKDVRVARRPERSRSRSPAADRTSSGAGGDEGLAGACHRPSGAGGDGVRTGPEREGELSSTRSDDERLAADTLLSIASSAEPDDFDTVRIGIEEGYETEWEDACFQKKKKKTARSNGA